MRVFWFANALVVAGCSLIVPDEPAVTYCRDLGHVGAPACRANFICADGICEACAPSEACRDGVDNDCNGSIDDGCPVPDPAQAGASSM